MAAKPKPMSQIKQLLRLHGRGAGKKHIARSLQISRNTVKSYLCKLAEAGWSADELLELDDHELERRFHSGSPAYKDDRFAEVTLADAILDRLIHSSHRFELKGESMRKKL